MARHFGVPTGWIHLLVLVGLCLTIVNSVKIAGVVLIAALIVIPGVSAKILSRNFLQMVLTSIAISVVGTLLGVITGYFHNLPPGPMVVTFLFAIFLGISVIRWIMVLLRKMHR
jgi:ABC-type Mn2+/Zn2+ transport system permease subunit